METTLDRIPDLVDQIPPDAWPVIDMAFKVTIALVLIWLALAVIAFWRRRAYNLTIASTARRSKKAQPDFLKVDKKARERAIDRGERHEEMLDEREEGDAEAALKAAKEPVGIAKRIAEALSVFASLFTLGAAIAGVVANVGKMGEYVENLSTWGRIQYLLAHHTIGVIVVLVVVAHQIYKYVSGKKWKGA